MASDAKLEGILIPMPVAFRSDGAVDDKAVDALVDFYLAAGVQGFFPLGTHGQGMVLEIDERKTVAERIVRRVAGRAPVVLHVGTANTYSSIELARHGAGLGVAALGIVPPYYYPHDDYEVLAHYRAIARAVPGVPLFIYDNTETTRVHITPPKVLKIQEAIAPASTLAGIKVSFVPYEAVLGYVFALPPSIGVFPGAIFSLYSGYSLGVRGTIHPPSSPFPEICVALYHALKRGDAAEARRQHDLLARILHVIGRFVRTHGRGVFGEVMRLRGLPVERFPRWECAPFTEAERRSLKESLAEAGAPLA
ncbi:MAG TPA: dihydrodipicolinate synthase family protein [candidate division Zixibacteria bacterium]|nr:dihydrodipicolinate synthase family protein [candidate division Zixibacteria bacterium]